VLLQQVLLVVIFCLPKGLCREYLGGDFAPDVFLSLKQSCLRLGFLLIVVVEDGRHVLSGAFDRGVVIIPEHLQQLVIICLLWIVVKVDRFSVIAQRVVRRLVLGSTSITHSSADDAWRTPELSLRKPKSAHSESCLLGFDTWFEQSHGWSP